jgi:predicted nucleic acid-binding Zn ribbon protein
LVDSPFSDTTKDKKMAHPSFMLWIWILFTWPSNDALINQYPAHLKLSKIWLQHSQFSPTVKFKPSLKVQAASSKIEENRTPTILKKRRSIPVYQLDGDDTTKILKFWKSINEAAKACKVAPSTIKKCINDNTSHRGSGWREAVEEEEEEELQTSTSLQTSETFVSSPIEDTQISVNNVSSLLPPQSMKKTAIKRVINERRPTHQGSHQSLFSFGPYLFF